MRVSRALARVLPPANLPLQALYGRGLEGEGAPRASAALRASQMPDQLHQPPTQRIHRQRKTFQRVRPK